MAVAACTLLPYSVSLSGGRPASLNMGHGGSQSIFLATRTVSHWDWSVGCSSTNDVPSLCSRRLQASTPRMIHHNSGQSSDTTKLRDSSPYVFLLILTSQCYTRCQWAREGTRGSAQYGVIICMALFLLLPSYTGIRRLESSREISVLAHRRRPSCDSGQAVRRGHHLGQPREEGNGKNNQLQNLSKSKLLTAKLSLSPEPPQHKTASKSHSNI